MKKNKFKLIILIIFVLIIFTWFIINPIGKFGISRFGFTIYSGIPIPVYDILIKSNGFFEIRKDKSHFISYEEIANLTKSDNPEIIIIGNGYYKAVAFDGKILKNNLFKIEIYDSKEAIIKFNEYKNKGKKVAIIIHTTC